MKVMDAPVSDIIFEGVKVHMIFAVWNMRQAITVLFFGTFSNSLMFTFLAIICRECNRILHYFPVSLCKFIAWYGLCTMFDFVIIAIIDFALQEYDGDLFFLGDYYE
jgi:hypothetical protein